MTVTAELEPARTSAAPGATSHLVLHVRNEGTSTAACTLRAETELGGAVTFDPATVVVGAGDTSHVSVTVGVGATTPPGPHLLRIDTISNDHATPPETAADGDMRDMDDMDVAVVEGTPAATVVAATATATIDVHEVADHRVALRPERARSAARGRHQLVIDNRGNVAVHVAIAVEVVDGDAVADPAAASVDVEPGTSRVVPVVLTPRERFERGPSHVHRFRVAAAGSDGKDDELTGVFEQLPRVQRWHLVAALSALAALLLAVLVWFALLKPAIEDIARDEADAALADDRAAMDARIADFERAAAEAEELPLGTPTDVRLEVDVSAGDEDDDAAAVPSGTVLSVTDVVLQNPTGAVGTVALLRDGEVLLQSELANFRDLDLHFVAPFRFEPGSSIALRVTCVEPGPGVDTCLAAATVGGFEDEPG
jgi:hypothetical protein